MIQAGFSGRQRSRILSATPGRGRPWVYGVAAAGRRGVAAVIDTLAQELRATMALLGVTRVAQIDRSLLEG